MQELKTTKRSPLATLSSAAIGIEKVRVAGTVRLRHLEKRGEVCLDTKELLTKVAPVEDWVDERLTKLIKGHPAAPWFTRIKGTSGEVMGKVLGEIERFGRYYDAGSPDIPSYVQRSPEEYIILKDDQPEVKIGIWVEAIERFTTPSKMRVYLGLAPGMRRERGEKLPFNIEARTMMWRLGRQFHLARNKYYQFYLGYKNYLVARMAGSQIAVLPTPKQRLCISCGIEVVKKAARSCPQCGGELSRKTEPHGVIWVGHLDNMAKRRELQLFSDHLWLVWRESLGLPIRAPYPIEKQGHSKVISPWDMVDR